MRRDEQRAPDYLAINPQGLVPALEVDGAALTQSLAICEWLEEVYPSPPLLPADTLLRAQVRAFAQIIACDIHPVQNLKILTRLRAYGVDDAEVRSWAATTIEEGLAACDALVRDRPGKYCFGDAVTLADICLVPQLANARRFGAPFGGRLLNIEAACCTLDAFRDAAPESQPDAED